MHSIFEIESLVILLLVVIATVAFAANRLKLPYTVALVLVGLALAFREDLKIEITPELILALFIPPVAFEAAFRLEWRHLRADLATIAELSIIGVVISTLITGVAVYLLAPQIPFAVALVFGALISATDPVAVVALFRSSNVAQRLSVIVESESLFNDGTAIVVYNLALGAALTSAFNPLNGVVDFLRVSAGGLLIGGALGWVVARVLAQIDDYLVETTLTTCLAFGAYLIAEYFHTSGVLAVVAAGLLCGTIGTRGMSPTTKIVVNNFWEYLAFIANSFVFLLIGLTIHINQFISFIPPIIVAIGAVLLSRAIVVYIPRLVPRLLGKTDHRSLPVSWQHVMFWGGLRGAVSLALALSLPTTLADRDTLRIMTFGVVLFTLIVQATSMPLLLRRLNLLQGSPRQFERDVRVGRQYAFNASWDRMEHLHREGLLTGDVWQGLQAQHAEERERLDQEMRDLFVEHSELERELIITARRESLLAERAAISEANQRGLIADEASRHLLKEVDERLEALAVIHHLTHDVTGTTSPSSVAEARS